jgi:hypothetical protein
LELETGASLTFFSNAATIAHVSTLVVHGMPCSNLFGSCFEYNVE